MTGSPGRPAPALVGRTRELGIIRSLLARAAAGEAQFVVLSGDAGIGKTALVEHASAGDAAFGLTLSGACLPLASISIPFLPIRAAIRAAGSAPTSPFGAGPAQVNDRDFIERLDTWLDTLCAAAPVLLIVDDLHWTDQSTLDALTYVVAGPAARRLAVLATVRAGEMPAEHPAQRWLTDIRRMPRVSELAIGPLDLAATGEQISGLLGGSAHPSLIEDVHLRTQGNPYFTRLMVAGLSSAARTVPDAVPDDLRSAVLRVWNGLAEPTRRVASVLAVGGRPMQADRLADIMRGPEDAAAVRALLAPAIVAGSVESDADGALWFHHPLNAEVLASVLDGGERRALHVRFAAALEAQAGDGMTRSETAVSIADHLHHAGDVDGAYAWALRAADALGDSGGAAERLRLIRRAVVLREQLPGAEESPLDLLDRLREAAEQTGAHADELDAVEGLLARTSRTEAPLEVAALLVRRAHLRYSLGLAFFEPDDPREAVELSASAPTSAEHAFALAELAHAEFWADDPIAHEHARSALASARASGDARALAYALVANAMSGAMTDDVASARVFASEAVECARAARDWWAFTHATLWEANAVEIWSAELYAERLRVRREQMSEARAPHTYVAWVSASEAASWMAVGDWRACQDRLRFALGSDPGPSAEVSAHLTAARLATWQGRQSEAEAHLARADELMAATSLFLALECDAVRAEVLLGAGDAEGAFQAALAGATSDGVPPTMCQWLMPLAARALADLAERARDAGEPDADVSTLLDELIAKFPHVMTEPGETTELWDTQVEALELIYTAERLRGRNDPASADAWISAVEWTSKGRLAWEETYASLRAAEALLGARRDRSRGADVLRHGLELAEQLQAQPIRERLEDLAVRARIPTTTPDDRSVVVALPGLTQREREVLARITAGRTYGEIARELVISEKTVSTHVSHLLAKTGTSNRVELSGLARRAGLAERRR